MDSEVHKRKSSRWWLWPLMPFAAVIGATVSTMAIGIIMWLGMKFQGGYSEDGWYFLYVMPIVTSAIWGGIYSFISYHMVPSGRLASGTVMVTLLSVLAVFILVATWVVSGIDTGTKIQNTAGLIASVLGAVFGLVHANSSSD